MTNLSTKQIDLEMLKNFLCDYCEEHYYLQQQLKQISKYQSSIYDEEKQQLKMKLQKMDEDITHLEQTIINLTNEINGEEYLEYEKEQQLPNLDQE